MIYSFSHSLAENLFHKRISNVRHLLKRKSFFNLVQKTERLNKSNLNSFIRIENGCRRCFSSERIETNEKERSPFEIAVTDNEIDFFLLWIEINMNIYIYIY